MGLNARLQARSWASATARHRRQHAGEESLDAQAPRRGSGLPRAGRGTDRSTSLPADRHYSVWPRTRCPAVVGPIVARRLAFALSSCTSAPRAPIRPVARTNRSAPDCCCGCWCRTRQPLEEQGGRASHGAKSSSPAVAEGVPLFGGPETREHACALHDVLVVPWRSHRRESETSHATMHPWQVGSSGLLPGLAALVIAGGGSSCSLSAPQDVLGAVLHVHAEISAGSRTAKLLGGERDGSGVLIDFGRARTDDRLSGDRGQRRGPAG